MDRPSNRIKVITSPIVQANQRHVSVVIYDHPEVAQLAGSADYVWVESVRHGANSSYISSPVQQCPSR